MERFGIWTAPSSSKKKFGYKLGSCESVCYLPDPYDSLVVRQRCTIKEVKQREPRSKSYKQKLPSDLFFSPLNGILLTNDQKKPQIHVLNPNNFDVYQTIGLPDAEAILSMCLFNNKICMVQRAEQGSDGKMILSQYSLNPESKHTE